MKGLADTSHSVNYNMNPTLSLIVPVFNGSRWLEPCLRSIQQQTYTDFECIVIDDASRDNSEAILKKYCSADPRFRFLQHINNQGAAYAKRTGIMAARGQYVLCIDQDDWIESSMVEQLYAKAQLTHADMVYCHYLEESYGETIPLYQDPVDSNKETTIKDILSWGSYFPALWNKLIRTSLLRDIYFPKATYSEDRAIISQVINAINNSAGVAEHLYHWRDEPTSTSRSAKRDLQNIIDDYQCYTTIIQALALDNRTGLRTFETSVLAHLDKLASQFPGNHNIINSYRLSVSKIIQHLSGNENSSNFLEEEIRSSIAKFKSQNAWNFSKHIRRSGYFIYSKMRPASIRKLFHRIRGSN